MSKLVTTSNFLNYPINTKYQIKQSNMKDIYLALAHARDSINRPLATRYTVSLNNDHSFDIKKLTRIIKNTFKETGFSFIYSFEYVEKKGLHLEMMIVTDQSKYSPEQVRKVLIKALINMDGVVITTENDYTKLALNYHQVRNEYLETGVKAGHNLKNEVHFKACVYRASYLAKQDNKQEVQYKKKFGTITG
ncbi:inovirus-type Gp2 protein [Acinetobacter sp. WCHA45]|uniref:inovirus-type Gp2 protein n=1 Tax=Acinetobacter sp. WCHA45 TaxID=2004644 RepID=UPI000B3BEA54|nr:inovirus-type Gp2 protein [Acinetobacter sp. WCHA45]AVZ84306.1 inovirus Gp2 family protein [Acinetobacter sp. WCHA45]